jgi:hypothetical protein
MATPGERASPGEVQGWKSSAYGPKNHLTDLYNEYIFSEILFIKGVNA